jgi:AraC family transcriptional regulator, regulatory protein of adaptative response / methylated-DNA-[protein]-cysteine methyltransferase
MQIVFVDHQVSLKAVDELIVEVLLVAGDGRHHQFALETGDVKRRHIYRLRARSGGIGRSDTNQCTAKQADEHIFHGDTPVADTLPGRLRTGKSERKPRMAADREPDHLGGMKDTHMIDRLSDDQLWDQVIRREPGNFFYAVTTMGVFCRPGCPSPRPLRKNVRFFRNVGEAEAAGFRACRRCDPKGERARLAQAVVQDACTFIEGSENIPSLDTLAERSGYSRFHFLRMFRDHTGLTPRSYAEGVRARRLQTALADGARVADAVADAGYGSESRVYEKTGELLGMTPGALRRGGEGEVVRTANADCQFGRLLVGTTDRGVCFIGFGQPDEVLLDDLRQRFPRADIVSDDAALANTVHSVLNFLEEPKQALDLPLDLRGTAFQQRVWRTLCQIPPGETRSYAEVAQLVGNRRAVRAVARSCASNPVALAVPCHRVIGSDGKLTGYRWGVPRKRALLAKEAAARHSG